MKKILSEIYTYPIKSLKGIALSSAKIENYGLQYDRKWMLINDENGFMSQRAYPQMALLKVSLFSDHLQVRHTTQDKLINIPLEENKSSETVNVKIWDDMCEAKLLPDDINQWFSEALEINCKLVYMPDNYQRKVDGNYAKEGEVTKFSDGFPYLLIGQSSLDDLNSRLKKPVTRDRFRPNLVISGFEPYAEDEWKVIQIGETMFRVAKPCARCRITTIDQDTAETGKEPLKTLSGYRMKDNKVFFGQNLLNLSGREIRTGDEVKII